MANDKPTSDNMLRVMIGSPNIYGEALRNEAFRRGFRSANQPIESVVAFLKSCLHMSITFGTRTTCPYCTKTMSVDARGELPDHRAVNGPCDGAGRGVVRMDSAGRAVFTSTVMMSIRVKQAGPGYMVECTAAEAGNVESVLQSISAKYRKYTDGGLVQFMCSGSGDKAAAALGVPNQS